MQHSTEPIRHSSHHWAACLLLVLIFLVYSNTFYATWHLDDYQNILTNPRIQIDSLSIDTLSDAVYDNSRHQLWRPVAFLTFAVNWYYGGHDVFGYHLVNTLLHLITAFFIYLVINRLLCAPALKGKYKNSRHFIALLATALWAVHPIQTQAVTYIVQRMTLLAGMFYMICIYCYIRARTDAHAAQKLIWSAILLFSFLLGAGSKENIILLPPGLFLIEMIFFHRSGQAFWSKTTIVVIAGALLAALAALSLMDVNLGNVFNGYRDRFFTPGQRVLTEFRILVFYLSQLLYPIPTRFSIEHDFALSTSLLSPWTTLPAVIAVAGLIGIAIWQMRKRPLVSFAILFFFINHGLESTVIPLELVFEHRNYLPSVFIFLPLAALVWQAIEYYRHKNRGMHALIAGFGVFLLVGFGAGTYIRNYAWETEWSLWMDARQKAPAMCRPVLNLAWSHFEASRQWNIALSMYNSALKRKMNRRDTRAVIFNNMADIYYRNGDNRKAEAYWRRAVTAAPAVLRYRYYMVKAIAGQQQWDAALTELKPLIEKHPDSVRYLNLKGNIMLYQQKPGPALEVFMRCLKIKPSEPVLLSNAGAAYLALGAGERAETMFKVAAALKPENNLRLMQLIGIYLITEKGAKARMHMQRLFSRASVAQIQNNLEQLSREPGCEDLYRVVGRHLADVLTDKSRRIENLFQLES